MKKNVRTILGGLFAAVLLAGFVSCSNSTGSDLLDEVITAVSDDVFSGDELTFTATCDSKSSRDVNLIIKYDRTAVGAKEQIAFVDAELEVTYNGEKIAMPSTLKFELEEYSSLDGNYVNGSLESRSAYQKEYKIKLPLNKKISTGGVLKVQLKSAKVGGEGAVLVDLGGVSASLIDNSEAANWYAELSDTEYQPLITKKNGEGLSVVDTPSEVTLFEGETDLIDWSSNVYLTEDKFVGSKKAIEISYKKGSTFVVNDNVIQLVLPWDGKYKVDGKIEGSVAFDSGNPAAEDLWPWDTESVVTFTFTPSDEDWTNLAAKGLAIQGHGSVITKVVLK